MATTGNQIPCAKLIHTAILSIMPMTGRSSQTLLTVPIPSMTTNMGGSHTSYSAHTQHDNKYGRISSAKSTSYPSNANCNQQ